MLTILPSMLWNLAVPHSMEGGAVDWLPSAQPPWWSSTWSVWTPCILLATWHPPFILLSPSSLTSSFYTAQSQLSSLRLESCTYFNLHYNC
jgi:hypothetical protein